MTQPALMENQTHTPRVYALDQKHLTEEQIAVTFAMTSRTPDAFDETAQRVSETAAGEFNEKWVVGYGHASVAEHAVLHLAVENHSRLAVDGLEDSRLASYTEKSSRYQRMESDYYHVPAELAHQPELRAAYVSAMTALFHGYQEVTDICTAHLERNERPVDGESARARRRRLQRQAMDSSRALLPAATLTNVGLTANARSLEHTIAKLLSSRCQERRDLGENLKKEARLIAPTLVKYAAASPYLEADLNRPTQLAMSPPATNPTGNSRASLLRDDREAETRLAAALLYRRDACSYGEAQATAAALTDEQKLELIAASTRTMSDHDPLPRDFEQLVFTFELIMDYGALREYRRHRIQSLLTQEITTALGRDLPPLVEEAGAAEQFDRSLEEAAAVRHRLLLSSPREAAYLVSHCHLQRGITTLNAREIRHLVRLRTSPQAHQAIAKPVLQLQEELTRAHPGLAAIIAGKDHY